MSEPEVNSRSSVDVRKVREGALSLLSHIAVSAREFYDSMRLNHHTRLGYGRLCVAAAEAVGHLLHDVELEDLEERIKLLEEHRIEHNREENQDP
jgi:hypothetical protein